MNKSIYIYNDEGVGELSLHCIKDYFSSEKITLISAKDIIQSGVPETADVFVMPGGADKPYANKLNGVGNDNIKKYVRQGGIYLGICAGAYYGCSSIEFQKGTKNEICEDRELNFFDGVAVGCLPEIAGNLYDQTLKSASVTSINFAGSSTSAFYWGGCYFERGTLKNHEVLAVYSALDKPAIISCEFGKGIAILSGVHFEVSQHSLERYDFNEVSENRLKTEMLGLLSNVNILNVKDMLERGCV